MKDKLYTTFMVITAKSALIESSRIKSVYCNTVGTHGTNPVHLVLDRSGKWLYVANYRPVQFH